MKCLDEIVKGVVERGGKTVYWNFVPEWYVIECEGGICVAKLGRGSTTLTVTYSEEDCRIFDVHA
jgi:hypothetical protein